MYVCSVSVYRGFVCIHTYIYMYYMYMRYEIWYVSCMYSFIMYCIEYLYICIYVKVCMVYGCSVYVWYMFIYAYMLHMHTYIYIHTICFIYTYIYVYFIYWQWQVASDAGCVIWSSQLENEKEALPYMCTRCRMSRM